MGGKNYRYLIYDTPGMAEARLSWAVSCRKRQKPQAPTLQAPIRNRQTRKVANAKVLNRKTNNLT